ncbi:MAG TPA: hypothetical protein VEN31_01720 [Candidatus Bathyarchaeia archaeon]|nr:hypothetical protein [Candidatus Bathyarchaeia archaeon]
MIRPTIPIDDLTAYLFGPGDPSLAGTVGPRLIASPRFRAFAETYRDKIRKKARGLRDDKARSDFAFELAVAVRLLEERRFAVEYEPYGVGQRAPDFRVTFRTQLRLNVEVRRLRPSALAPGSPVDPARLIRAVCDKLGQLPPAMINVLFLGADGPSSAADALAPAMLSLQERATRKDEMFFEHRGFTGTRDFMRHYQRLSGAVWLAGEEDAPPSLWRNPQARHPLPADLARALSRLVLEP